jgi:beta-mannosidase
MSEFGFESFPSLKTVKGFCPEEELYLDSPIMNNHQKNEGGNKKILRYMRKWFNIPKEFGKQIILSQITQAEAIQYGVEYWRQNRNDFHCMGSLYWQLNDCWPVASWSSFDYHGRWKALHYFARRFYAPLLASVRECKTEVELWGSNDFPFPRSVKYFWKLYNNQGELLNTKLFEVRLPPCSSLRLGVVDLLKFLKDRKTQDLIMFYGFQGEPLSKGMRLFNSPKRVELKNPEISWDLVIISDNCNKLEGKLIIHSKNLSLYVFVNSSKCDFAASDNYFSMEPGEERVIVLEDIKFAGKKDNGAHTIEKKDFRVASLYDLME